jgi:AhpC/TSA family
MNPIALLRGALAASVLSLASIGASATAAIGKPAPDFVATDTSGQTVKLSQLRGKTVVLEWVNPGCPYVRRHYGANNMQATQKAAVERGVVWLAINSTATEAADYLPAPALATWMKEQKAAATATLMDAQGQIGRSYGARTTPHMFVIDAKGLLVYAGAIDNKPRASGAEIATATNHVRQAVDEVLAGKPVSVPATQPYGCTVKYSSV